jgi:transcriptional regulator with XRE-family HTH domain
MTQSQLGEMIGGVGKAIISYYEKGKAYPTLEKLVLMREIFEVDLESLVFRKLYEGESPLLNFEDYAKKLGAPDEKDQDVYDFLSGLISQVEDVLEQGGYSTKTTRKKK